MTDKCTKCDGEIYGSESLSRCLRCRKATPREVSGEEYFKNKQGRDVNCLTQQKKEKQ